LETAGSKSLAQRFGVRIGRVYEWRDGEMSLENFYCILTGIPWDYADVGRLPSLEDRRAAGVQAAVQRALPGERTKPNDSLTLAEYLAVSFVLGDDLLMDVLDEGRKPTALEWQELTVRVATKLRRAGISATPLLPSLFDKWKDVVARVRLAIPFNWLEGGRDDAAD